VALALYPLAQRRFVHHGIGDGVACGPQGARHAKRRVEVAVARGQYDKHLHL